MLMETQRNAWIDSDPILAFLYVAFLRQIVENRKNSELQMFASREINATQVLTSLCELTFNRMDQQKGVHSSPTAHVIKHACYNT